MKETKMKKFKDIQALEQAYSALEKEFTRKCQKIKELETILGTMEENSTPSGDADCVENKENILPQTEQEALAADTRTDDPDFSEVGLLSGKGVGCDWEKQSLLLRRILDDSILMAKIVAEYVKRQQFSDYPTIMGGGGAFCRTPERRPKSFKEASDMAKSFLFRD